MVALSQRSQLVKFHLVRKLFCSNNRLLLQDVRTLLLLRFHRWRLKVNSGFMTDSLRALNPIPDLHNDTPPLVQTRKKLNRNPNNLRLIWMLSQADISDNALANLTAKVFSNSILFIFSASIKKDLRLFLRKNYPVVEKPDGWILIHAHNPIKRINPFGK